jgi:transcriptional regulator with XRE-family HTH domain
MSLKEWEDMVLSEPGAAEHVHEIEDELRIAVGLTALRDQSHLTQRELAERMGVSQPRVAAIEASSNITIDVLQAYARAVGGELEIAVVHGDQRTTILAHRESPS